MGSALALEPLLHELFLFPIVTTERPSFPGRHAPPLTRPLQGEPGGCTPAAGFGFPAACFSVAVLPPRKPPQGAGGPGVAGTPGSAALLPAGAPRSVAASGGPVLRNRALGAPGSRYLPGSQGPDSAGAFLGAGAHCVARCSSHFPLPDFSLV